MVMAGGGAVTALTHIPPASLNKFVHHVLDGLCGGGGASHHLASHCALDKFWQAGQEVKNLARDLSADKLTREEAGKLLSSLGPESTVCVCDAICARRDEIREAVVREALLNTTTLTDFDWNVRMSLSSSTVLDLNQPLLTLTLHTASPHSHSQDTTVEMNTAEVDALLATLKEAQASLSNQQ